MPKVITKQDLCLEMATEGKSLARIAKVLAISQRQVLRYLIKAEQEVENGRESKPRKPKPRRSTGI